MIQAIETVYNGYRFRSRLEARWAVFFDAAGIMYEYEPEGYRMSDGTMYLPDFFLPEFNIYVEIKASRDNDDGKAERFADEASAFTDDAVCGGILVCYGQSTNHDMVFMSNCESDDSGGGFFNSDGLDVRFMINEITGDNCLIIYWNKWESSFYRTKNVYTTGGDEIPLPEMLSQNRILTAELKARQARFEHGEKP